MHTYPSVFRLVEKPFAKSLPFCLGNRTKQMWKRKKNGKIRMENKTQKKKLYSNNMESTSLIKMCLYNGCVCVLRNVCCIQNNVTGKLFKTRLYILYRYTCTTYKLDMNHFDSIRCWNVFFFFFFLFAKNINLLQIAQCCETMMELLLLLVVLPKEKIACSSWNIINSVCCYVHKFALLLSIEREGEREQSARGVRREFSHPLLKQIPGIHKTLEQLNAFVINLIRSCSHARPLSLSLLEKKIKTDNNGYLLNFVRK